MNTLSRILMLVNITPGLQFEYDNDIHKGRLSITRAVKKDGGCEWETKNFSDIEPLECDGDINTALAYVSMLAGVPVNDFSGMSLDEMYHEVNTSYINQ